MTDPKNTNPVHPQTQPAEEIPKKATLGVDDHGKTKAQPVAVPSPHTAEHKEPEKKSA